MTRILPILSLTLTLTACELTEVVDDTSTQDTASDTGTEDTGEALETFSPTAGALYKLHTEFQGSEHCLEGNDPASEVKNGAAFLNVCEEVTGQYWSFQANGDYFLGNTEFQGAQMCLEGNEAGSEVKDGNAFLNACSGVTGQNWRFVVDGDFVLMQTEFQGTEKCLEGNEFGSDFKNGAAFMDDCSGVTGQRWVLEEVSAPPEPELITLHNVFLGDALCLEGNEAGSDQMNGAAFMDTCVPATGQQWYAVPAGEGEQFQLKTKFQGDYKCLEGNEPSSEVNGGNAFMSDCADVTGQLWYEDIREEGSLLKNVQHGDARCLEGNQKASEVQGGGAFMNTCSAPATGQFWYGLLSE